VFSHHRSTAIPEMTRFVGTKVEFGADADEFSLNADVRELPLVHSDTYLNKVLLKSCEAALADKKRDVNDLRTKVENAISANASAWSGACRRRCAQPRHEQADPFTQAFGGGIKLY